MAMTQEQIEWLKANREALASEGYDPDETEISSEGELVKVPRYGYLETLARQGAKSILPTGASFAAGAAAMPFGAPLGPLGMAGAGLFGGLMGGGAAGYAQEKALDYLAPEFQEAARRSAEQNPKTAWLGDQAAALATMKPNVRALANLSVLGKGAMNSPAMREALANAGINAGGALAGQGVNMLQGGDFEPGRFAADTVFGSIYTDPNKLGQRLGLKPSSDTTPLAKVKDLTYEQSEMRRARAGTPADADWAKLPPIQVEVASKAEEKLAAKVRAAADKAYTKWWKSETIPTDKMFTEMMNESKLTISPENLAKLREMPEAIAAMKSPEAFKDFVWSSSEEALQEAWLYKKRQGELLGANEAENAEKYRSLRDSAKLAGDMARGRLAAQEGSTRELAAQMGAGRERSEALKAAEPYAPKGPDYAPGKVPPFIPEPVKPQSKAREVISKDFLKPSAEDVAKVAENESAMAKLQAEQDAVELAKLKDLEAADALTQEAKARLLELEKPFNERVKLNKDLGLPEALAKASNQETPELAQARQNAKEAEALRDELYNRLSRSDADAGKPLTQAELARMTQVAAKRGLTLTFEDLGNNRGQYVLATKDGQPLLKVNPLTATIDTIAHEVGHDVFNRSASEGMQKSLMETALGSDAYKRELAKRLEQGATQEQAHSIAAEEGLIDAFARAGSQSDASDVRSWFKAFKASIKHLSGSKLSPEDAVAWMHYATHNDTPWSGSKGRTAFTGSDERNQGGIENGRYETEAERFLAKGAPGLQRGRDGTIDPGALKAWLGKQTKAEQELLKDVPFTKATPEDLLALVKEHGPKVEVVTYGMDRKVSEGKQALDQLTHDWYDNLTPRQRHVVGYYADGSAGLQQLAEQFNNPAQLDNAHKYIALKRQVLNEPKDTSPRATSAYSKVSAFDTGEPMPSWTATKGGKNVQRVDVVLPADAGGKTTVAEWAGRAPQRWEDSQPINKELWRADNLHENLPNTLGWAMIQYKTGPRGEKIAVIVESQSRWGQFQRGQEKLASKEGKVATKFDHPLLKDYNRLILKAAIDQARKEGATHIMLSDGETAMMTEGHDANANPQYKLIDKDGTVLMSNMSATRAEARMKEIGQTGDKIVRQGLDQEPGMRLNYDTILPKIAEEFTGSKGERVSLGEHKNAFEENHYGISQQELETVGRVKPRSDLIFRNPDGTPKTDVSGRMYALQPVEKSFDPSVRNQGPSLGPLDSEQRKVSRINPVVGDAFTATSKTIPRVIGHLTAKLSEAAKLNESQKLEFNNHLANEMDNGTRVAPPADLAAAYEQMRNVLMPEVPRMFNAEGFGIRSANVLRAHGENPTYFPLHHMSPDVRDVITNRPGSPEYAGLRAEFIDWTAQYLINKKRMPADKARIEARARFDKEVNESNRPQDASEAMGFAGVRKPEGAPLPPSWRSNDLMGNLTNYIKRVATDFAVQKHIESSPEVMAALGAKKYGQDKEIPQDILDATAPVISNKHVQNVLKDLRGRAADDSVMADIGRVISPLALGHISRGADVMSTTGKGLAYLRPSEYYEGTKMFVDKLSNWAELTARSHESGLNRLDTGANMRHVMGVGDANVSFLTKAAALINKGGLNQLESFARTIAQAWGETIVAINRAKAMSGDQKSVEFLDTLSKDWRSRDDLDLSGQVGRLLQGSYDTQQLPQWMIDGPLAPYLVWSKWSMGQLQAFNDFAVAPLLKGDAKPLVGQILIGVLGGAAVNQVQEWVNNRDTRDVNWKELEAWAEQNKGEFGGTGQKLLASKLLAYTQKMGTFGFAGDLVKMTTEAMAGQVPQAVLHNPTMEFVFNTSKHGAAAMSAISSGEDVGLVLKKLTKDLAVNNSQVVRATRNWVDTEENLAYDDRRRQNLFNFLRGEGAGANTFAVSYKDLAEKEFDKTKEPADMVAQAGALLEKAATDATSQEDFVARLRKLGTSQNNIMPNPRRQPDKAFKYLKWVHDAEGADESRSTQQRWLEEDARAKYRRALVSPGSAGAR